MDAQEARLIVYLIDLVVEYGVPAAFEAYKAWSQADPEGKEPEELRKYVKSPNYYRNMVDERRKRKSDS